MSDEPRGGLDFARGCLYALRWLIPFWAIAIALIIYLTNPITKG